MKGKQTLIACLVVFVGITSTLIGDQDGAQSSKAKEVPKVKFGEMVLKTELVEPVKDAKEPCYTIKVTVENPTGKDAEIELPITITKTESQAMSRSMPMPKVIRTETRKILVEAHKTKVLRFTLPADVKPKSTVKKDKKNLEVFAGLQVSYSVFATVAKDKRVALHRFQGEPPKVD